MVIIFFNKVFINYKVDIVFLIVLFSIYFLINFNLREGKKERVLFIYFLILVILFNSIDK